MPLARKIERRNSKKFRQRETSRFSIGRATVYGNAAQGQRYPVRAEQAGTFSYKSCSGRWIG